MISKSNNLFRWNSGKWLVSVSFSRNGLWWYTDSDGLDYSTIFSANIVSKDDGSGLRLFQLIVLNLRITLSWPWLHTKTN